MEASLDLPTFLKTNELPKEKLELYHFVPLFDKIDSALEIICQDLNFYQKDPFSAETKEQVLLYLDVIKHLLENGSNKSVFSSYDRLNSLLLVLDPEILIKVLQVIFIPASKLTLKSIKTNMTCISIERIKILSEMFNSFNGLDTSLLCSDEKFNFEEVSFSFYRLKEDDKQAATSDDRVFLDKSNSTNSSGLVLFKKQINSIENVFSSTLESSLNHSIPQENLFELSCKLNVAFYLNDKEQRTKLLQAKLLATCISIVLSSQISEIRFDLNELKQYVALIHPEKEIPWEIRTSSILVLDACARYKLRFNDLLVALNVSANHGVLTLILKKIIVSVVPDQFINAYFTFLAYIISSQTGGNAFISAGLVQLLLKMLKSNLDLIVNAKCLTTLDNVISAVPSAFNLFTNCSGLHQLIEEIQKTLDYTREFGVNDKGSSHTKATFKFLLHLLQTSTTSDSLRTLIDGPMLKILGTIFKEPETFKGQIFAFALMTMSAFIHNEPSCLLVINEVGLPTILLDSISRDILVNVDVVSSLPHALGALCLNQQILSQVVQSQVLKKLLFLFLKGEYLECFQESDVASVLGSIFDELVRHHPTLKPIVLDILIEIFKEIPVLTSKLLENKEIDATNGCFLFTGKNEKLVDQGVKFVNSVHEIKDSIIPQFMENVARFLETFFQNPQHSIDFVNKGAIPLILDLYTLDAIPYDFSATVFSSALSHVCRLLGETHSELLISNIFSRLIPKLKNLIPFFEFTDETSFFSPFVTLETSEQITAQNGLTEQGEQQNAVSTEQGEQQKLSAESLKQNEQKAQFFFRNLVCCQAFIGLMGDLYCSSPLIFNRTSTTVMTAFSSEDGLTALKLLNLLHRSCIWEFNLFKRAFPKSWLTTQKALKIKENFPFIEASETVDEDLTVDPSDFRVMNARFFKFLLTQIPSSLIPLFTGIAKMISDKVDLNSARPLSSLLAQSTKLNLDWERSRNFDRMVKYGYSTIILGSSLLLFFFDARLNTILTGSFIEFQGIEALVGLAELAASDLKASLLSNEVKGQLDLLLESLLKLLEKFLKAKTSDTAIVFPLKSKISNILKILLKPEIFVKMPSNSIKSLLNITFNIVDTSKPLIEPLSNQSIQEIKSLFFEIFVLADSSVIFEVADVLSVFVQDNSQELLDQLLKTREQDASMDRFAFNIQLIAILLSMPEIQSKIMPLMLTKLNGFLQSISSLSQEIISESLLASCFLILEQLVSHYLAADSKREQEFYQTLSKENLTEFFNVSLVSFKTSNVSLLHSLLRFRILLTRDKSFCLIDNGSFAPVIECIKSVPLEDRDSFASMLIIVLRHYFESKPVLVNLMKKEIQLKLKSRSRAIEVRALIAENDASCCRDSESFIEAVKETCEKANSALVTLKPDINANAQVNLENLEKEQNDDQTNVLVNLIVQEILNLNLSVEQATSGKFDSELYFECFLLSTLTELCMSFPLTITCLLNSSKKFFSFLFSNCINYKELNNDQKMANEFEKRQFARNHWAGYLITTIATSCDSISNRKFAVDVIYKAIKEASCLTNLNEKYSRIFCISDLLLKILSTKVANNFDLAEKKKSDKALISFSILLLDKKVLQLLSSFAMEIDLNYPKVIGSTVSSLIISLESLTRLGNKISRAANTPAVDSETEDDQLLDVGFEDYDSEDELMETETDDSDFDSQDDDSEGFSSELEEMQVEEGSTMDEDSEEETESDFEEQDEIVIRPPFQEHDHAESMSVDSVPFSDNEGNMNGNIDIVIEEFDDDDSDRDDLMSEEDFEGDEHDDEFEEFDEQEPLRRHFLPPVQWTEHRSLLSQPFNQVANSRHAPNVTSHPLLSRSRESTAIPSQLNESAIEILERLISRSGVEPVVNLSAIQRHPAKKEEVVEVPVLKALSRLQILSNSKRWTQEAKLLFSNTIDVAQNCREPISLALGLGSKDSEQRDSSTSEESEESVSEEAEQVDDQVNDQVNDQVDDQVNDQVENVEMAGPEATEAQAEDDESSEDSTQDPPPVFVDPGMDATFLEALPVDVRREVIDQYFEERRAAHPLPTVIETSQEFISRLRSDIREEFQTLERNFNADYEEPFAEDMDFASFMASLSPPLRQSILAEQGQEILSRLPPALNAEASVLLERAQQTVNNPNIATREPTLKPKKQEKKDAGQLMDLSSCIGLIRLLYSKDLPNKRVLFKLFFNLCQNSKSRAEILNFFVILLIEQPSNLIEIEELCFKLKTRGKPTTPKTPKKKISHFQVESESNLIKKRTCELLSFLTRFDSDCVEFFVVASGYSFFIDKRKIQLPLVVLFEILKNCSSFEILEELLYVISNASSVIDALFWDKRDALEKKQKLEQEQESQKSNQESDQKSNQKSDQKSDQADQADQADLVRLIEKPFPEISAGNLESLVDAVLFDNLNLKGFNHLLTSCQFLGKCPGCEIPLITNLIQIAKKTTNQLEKDLQELSRSNLFIEQESGSLILEKLSSGNSCQLKLLRCIKIIDTLMVHQPVPDTRKKFKEIYFNQLLLSDQHFALVSHLCFDELENVLAKIRENEELMPITNTVLPSIESFLILCKQIGNESESLILKFTELNRKCLNYLVRNNPLLLNDSFSILVSFKVLDFENKRIYFKQQLNIEKKSSSSLTINLNITRPNVFEDSFNLIMARTGQEIKFGKLNVRFLDEEGVDAGGVTREWFSVLSRQMFNPDYALFKTSAADKITYQPNRCSWVNPDHLLFFKFVGRIIGKAIYDSRLLDCYFTRSFYKHILGLTVDYKDFEAVDPEFYKSIIWILESNQVEDLDLTFSTEIDEFGKTKIVDLKENGREIQVNTSNKQEFVQLVTEMKLFIAIKPQIEAFLEGFNEIIPRNLISIFNEQELELLISGMPDIDIDDWKNNTEYHGYTSTSPQIQWFWRAVRSFDLEEKAKLLQFVTGTSKVPLEGFKHLQGSTGVQKFQIHKDFSNVNRLPSAHTCFNQLDLPLYEDYQTLRERLYLAMNECSTGFGFS